MRTRSRWQRCQASIGVALLCLVAAAHAVAAPAPRASNAQQEIQNLLGAGGRMQNGAFVVTIPRTDLSVTMMGQRLPPGFDLYHYIAWTPVRNQGNQYAVGGYLVVLETEMNAVATALNGANISLAALVRHMIGEQPRLMYVHFQARGNYANLARSLRAAMGRTATPLPVRSGTPLPAPALDARRVQRIVGRTGVVEGGALILTQGRTGVRLGGVELPAGMGPFSAAHFIGTNERAMVGGEVVLTAGEIDRAVRTLRQAGFTLSALHVHLVGEDPKLYFLHFSAMGTAENLARAVRQVFDQVRGSARR